MARPKKGGRQSRQKKKSAAVIRLTPEVRLKRNLTTHLTSLGFVRQPDGTLELPGEDKDTVRALHATQRADRLLASNDFLKTAWGKFSHHFADGAEVIPDRIELRLSRIKAGTWESDLFRLACMSWSVPVSAGYGRRLRYLVWDAHNDKLAGVIALGDPVFNLAVRDNLIGWTTADRGLRLVNILDAYVLGAIPPYSHLLGGKAVACLVRSREIYNHFSRKYGSMEGVISGAKKKAHLLAVTTSSSMGRSSIYNRLKIGDVQYFQSIGFTEGWGHFHIPDDLFLDMRRYLRTIRHPYADQNRFGQGPNWRLRSIRAALDAVGYSDAILRHGIKREVFMCQLAENATSILKKGRGRPNLKSLQHAHEISRAAVERWMIPRARTRPDFLHWTREQMLARILGDGRAHQAASFASTG
ncbi:Druantia anti-phage system protein DruA [Hyphomicrobium sp. CS1BSMeth3]|jgi:hypothetical protein|uniref:Druantia anti-phage system protein DruA n=1 Tax=Hyphomicrobium sp. CS1BSMeth3 TaxID=1892844 RepID=UPI00086D4E00|nr:Druantia anti-phage system protein DruA [Hyphomicrobium sp. CS1BSMeth3]ODT30522.1 MAG: hypothetical protein ABS54_02350 [Hyphomicrobium sp. SCN 65-11]